MGNHVPHFTGRHDAGRKLATELLPVRNESPIVLALAYEAVPIAFEVAQTLDAPLDLLQVQTIGAPNHPELSIGAIVHGRHAHAVWSREMLEHVRPSPGYLRRERERHITELARRRAVLRGERPGLELCGRIVIVVAERMATGGTARFVLEALRESGARRRILAVPIAARSAVATMAGAWDDFIFLQVDEGSVADGRNHFDNSELTEKEALQLMEITHDRDRQPA